MQLAKVKFHEAEKDYYFLPEYSEQSSVRPASGDWALVESELGQDLVQIIDIFDWQGEQNIFEADQKNISDLKAQSKIGDFLAMIRPASDSDLEQQKKLQKKYPQYKKEFRDLMQANQVSGMKLVDVHETFDGKHLTFYFTANNRVDFRDLVRDLAKVFHKKIRLQQIGVRDGAKLSGDVGSCGRALCCRAWLHTIGNVSPEFIKDQELMHRGAERLAGACGRLKCCLRYEEENYKYLKDTLPKVGEEIKTKAGKGVVRGVHLLKGIVDLEIDGALIQYPYLEGNLCGANCGGNCASCAKTKVAV